MVLLEFRKETARTEARVGDGGACSRILIEEIFDEGNIISRLGRAHRSLVLPS